MTSPKRGIQMPTHYATEKSLERPVKNGKLDKEQYGHASYSGAPGKVFCSEVAVHIGPIRKLGERYVTAFTYLSST